MDSAREVTIDQLLEDAALVACTSDMQHALNPCDVL